MMKHPTALFFFLLFEGLQIFSHNEIDILREGTVIFFREFFDFFNDIIIQCDTDLLF